MSKSTLNKKQIEEIVYLLDLCSKVAAKYTRCANAYEVAVKGMRMGLIKYSENWEKNKGKVELDAYLTWYMKTAIEFELGEDNEDTRAWGNM